MKKLFAMILTVCSFFCFPFFSAGVQAEGNVIALRLNSSIAGCTRADAEKLLELHSGQVDYYEENGYAIFIANCAGGDEHAHMDAGRTYWITYTLAASEGFMLPEALTDGDVSLECGKGVSKVSCSIIDLQNTDPSPVPGEAKTTRVLRINAKVVVDGSPAQRVIGWLKDLILKIRSWSLY